MYKVVIGLEVHSELKTETKCFCSCENKFGGEPNTRCCPVCTAMPGALPVLNKKAVEYAIKAGLSVGCRINEYSVFERKNYFYPDLAKAYQISQLEYPLCVGGHVDIEVDGKKKTIRLDRIHLEEDAGKLIHSPNGTMVDYNRAGVPLIEIVSMPDIESAEEAVLYLQKLRATLLYLGVSDCKMQEGSLRCDVNLSLHKEGEPFGTRTEMKNLNSFRAVYRAIKYEAKRQEEELEAGREIVQETRRWDDNAGKSYSMRSKEDAQDYRYFPDPDIVPIIVRKDYIEKIQKDLPKLAYQRAEEYVKNLGLTEQDALLLTNEKYVSDYFDQVIKEFNEPKFVCNWILGEVFKKLNTLDNEEIEILISPKNMAKLLKLYHAQTIGQNVARKLLDELWGTDDDPEIIVKEKGLAQNNDAKGLEEIIKNIMQNNQKAVEELKNGNQKTMAFFVGQAMKATSGKANPKLVNEIVQKLIK
ncbi:MAG: Asp-tRNA(Asn)/Glu-tRNA(Gln) amidotransferase subunit GatB [Clostridia bacterium]|nr:Asp-tRNA(Asn)/Glu-tRNA(Gln) amidotransferase subunit GatB [Clostridia bacterium]